MKTLTLILALMTVSSVFAQNPGYLKKEDQQYYKNDSFEGMNKMERIDSLVKEMNKVYGEMAVMKSEISKLKEEVELLKNKK
jgi:peptidoglycan hydrolase CwlO-like protein